jgi:amino acid transporter
MKAKTKLFLQQSAMVAAVVAGGVVAGMSSTEFLPAQLITDADCMEGTVCNPDFRETFVNFINYFLTFLGLIAVAFIIYAGFLMIIAQGEEESVQKGKKIILWAIIGLLVVMLSYAIVNFVIRASSNAL